MWQIPLFEEPKIRGLLIAPDSYSFLTQQIGPQFASDSEYYLKLDEGLNVFIGKNGAGKTTILRMLASAARVQVMPYEGLVLDLGTKFRLEALKYLGMLFELGAKSPRETYSFNSKGQRSGSLLSEFIELEEENFEIYMSFIEKCDWLVTRALNFETDPYSVVLVPTVICNSNLPKTFKLEELRSDYIEVMGCELREEKDLAMDLRKGFLEKWKSSPLCNLRNIRDLLSFTDSPNSFAEGTSIFLEPIGGEELITMPESNVEKVAVLTITSGIDGTFQDYEPNESIKEGLSRLLSSKSSISLDMAEDFGYQINKKIHEFVDEIMPSLADMSPFIGNPFNWLTGSAPVLKNSDGLTVNSLSNAENRWLRIAVNMSILEPTMVLIDEPESGLHRKNEEKVSEVLSGSWTDSKLVCIATHSPEFLNREDIKIFRLANGKINEFESSRNREIEALGLRKSDLLGLVSKFLVVEGEHEKIVFEKLFGEELQKSRIKILVARGAKNFSGVIDSNIVFDFTEADIFAVMDNLEAEEVQNVWNQSIKICKESNYVNAAGYLRNNLPNRDSGESKFLSEFLTRALESNEYERFDVYGLTKPDIILYFPESSFFLKESWDNLRVEYTTQKNAWTGKQSFVDFKSWLKKNKGAKVGVGEIEKALENLDQIPLDFTKMVNALIGNLEGEFKPRDI
jgi:ABC-type multidrug transport system ATPase subunit